LPPLTDGKAPQTREELWAGFDPRAEPLDVEVLKEWEEDGVVLRVLRYRIGIFKGKKAKMAAVYGFPKGGKNLPGLVQIHGGGQYADHKAVLTNAKRGYATISISWAGRISAPDYRVGPNEVKLFWDGATDDPAYKITTDWGALDGYHAPSRNPENNFPTIPTASWTLDAVESPRNNSWFLCTLGARRALTFLEKQAEVNGDKLGVYGHSMGGKLTVMTTGCESRVKAAAPSCGGISDRSNKSPLFRATIGDDAYLQHISCPIMFLSPANDFHGRINDLQTAVTEIQSKEWRVTCAPHHNHQDTANYEVATQLWFDQHLKGTFSVPQTPRTELTLDTKSGVPSIVVLPEASKAVVSVDVFYTQQGQIDGEKDDSNNTKARFWHHADATKKEGRWTAELPVFSTDKPLWVYANVVYPLDQPVTGAGYYYGSYTAEQFNLSSLMAMVKPAELKAAGVKATLQSSLMIETFEDGWEKEWFTYKPGEWARKTHKIYDPQWTAPADAKLELEVRSTEPNKLVVGFDEFATEIQLAGGEEWQPIVLSTEDFHNAKGEALPAWSGIRELQIGHQETLRNRATSQSLKLGGAWRGGKPAFRNLQWIQRAGADSRPAKPNVVLLLTDDLGWQDVKCYDIDEPSPMETPNIDALAKTGVMFWQAYSPAPTCAPSRAAILSGKHPARLQKTHVVGGAPPSPHAMNSPYMPPWYSGRLLLSEVTIAEALKGNGYTTGCVGKWHVAINHNAFPQPEDQGFDFARMNRGTRQPMKPHRLAGFATKAKGDPFCLDADGFPRHENSEDALTFLKEHKGDPFFLYFATWLVHAPIHTRSEALLKKYCEKMKVPFPTDPKRWEMEGQRNPYYAAMVESLDHYVGQVLDYLAGTDDPRWPGHRLAENTYVIFTSDNGGFEQHPGEIITDNEPLDKGKINAREGGVRVPLIIRGPGIGAGAESEAMVNGIDFYPTILSWTGTEKPKEQHLDGCDLAPYLGSDLSNPGLITDGSGRPRDMMTWHFPHSVAMQSTIRKGGFKLIRNWQGHLFKEKNAADLYQLYDDSGKRVDIEEAKNLAAAMPEMAREMDRLLQAQLDEMKASPPYLNPRAAANMPGKDKICRVLEHGRDGDRVWVKFEENGAKVVAARLIYTDNGGHRYEEWYRADARLAEPGRAEAVLPEGATHYVFNLIDENHYLVSHPQVKPANERSEPYSKRALRVE